MSNTPDTAYVQVGRMVYGPCKSYAEAARLSNGDAGGVVVDHVGDGCTLVDIGKLAAAKPAPKADGVLAEDVLPAVADLSDEWDVLQMAGLNASEKMEGWRWYLGDLATKVTKRYGEKSLKKFAGDVKIAASKTLNDYWRCSRFYPVDARAEYPSLTWSHYREAIRLGDVEEAMDWLGQAVDNGWSVVRLGQAISKKQGKTVHVRHAFDVVCLNKGQGKVLLSMSFDQCDEFIRRFQEGQSKDEFNLSLAVAWIDYEEPAA